jgi:hypothetical protein
MKPNPPNIQVGSMIGNITIGNNYGSIETINNSCQQKSLADAASEIQRLLTQLKETNPAATELEQISYVNIATQPELKQRAVDALKEGCETAIDEFVLENKYLKVVKAVLKGWMKGSLE